MYFQYTRRVGARVSGPILTNPQHSHELPTSRQSRKSTSVIVSSASLQETSKEMNTSQSLQFNRRVSPECSRNMTRSIYRYSLTGENSFQTSSMWNVLSLNQSFSDALKSVLLDHSRNQHTYSDSKDCQRASVILFIDISFKFHMAGKIIRTAEN